jgi:hypothetical protein
MERNAKYKASRKEFANRGFDSRKGPWKFSSDVFFLLPFSKNGFHSASKRSEYKELDVHESVCNDWVSEGSLAAATNVMHRDLWLPLPPI